MKTRMRGGWTWCLPGTDGGRRVGATPAAGDGDHLVEIDERAGAAG
jgi:hypothetical protein